MWFLNGFSAELSFNTRAEAFGVEAEFSRVYCKLTVLET